MFSGDSHNDIFVASGAQSLGLTVTDGFGYGTWLFGNPNLGGYSGLTFVLQAAVIQGSTLQISTPVLTQLQ